MSLSQSNPETTLSTHMWRPLTAPGCERGELLKRGDDWILRGTILRFAEYGPAEVKYEVVADVGWVTRTAIVRCRDDRGERILQIIHHHNLWYANETLLSLPADCADIDIAWSPSTNTLPIRRLGLNTRRTTEPVTAAWIRLPALSVEPLSQSYERIEPNVFLYSSNGGRFTAQITVDDLGIVNNYSGIWERVTASAVK